MEETMEKKGWFGRNWKWFVPVVGCGTILVCVGCVGIIVVTVFGAIKSSDVYEEAFIRVQENSAAQQALGEPIKDGFLVSGSIEITGSTGSADFTIPVSGPKASGTVYVVARRSAGVWEYTTLELELSESGERIDLLKR